MAAKTGNLDRKDKASKKLSDAASGFGVGVTVAWFIVESLQFFRMPEVAVFLFVAIAAGAVCHVLALPISYLGRLIGIRRAFWATVPAAGIVWVLLEQRVEELFTGDWISQQPWQPAALILTLLLLAFGVLVVGGLLLRASVKKGRIPFVWGFGLLVFSVLCFVLDRSEMLARRYLAAHDILAFFGLVAAGLVGVASWNPRWRRLGLAHILFGVLSVLVALLGIVDLHSSFLRETLLRSARLSPRVFVEFLGSESGDSGIPIDREKLSWLQRRRPMEPALLDRLIPNRRHQDIVLVTVDTLRYDALAGGNAKTPVMDNFLKASLSFSKAWSQFPSTRYAVNSFLAGQYPTSVDLESPEAATLGENLPESLAEAGFETMAFTSFPGNLFQLEKSHLSRGFQVFVNDSELRKRRSERVVERAIRALNNRAEDAPPVFLWLHIFDPHGPFTNRGNLSAGATLRERYDKEVEHADACLGRFFDFVDAELTSPLVVLHSDHGEEFQDHGGVGHNSSLYDEQIHVPLAFRGTGISAGVCDQVVELIDLPATIREWVGLPSTKFDAGHSLVPILMSQAEESWPPPFGFSQFRWPQFVHGNLDAVMESHWKLIHDRNLGLYELYDLESDPHEQRNLSSSNPEELSRLRGLLKTFRHYAGSAPENTQSDEQVVQTALTVDLGQEDLDRLKRILRRENMAQEESLPLLLDHDDFRIRYAALVHVAAFGSTTGLEHLRKRLPGNPNSRRNEALVALAIYGDPIPLNDIPLVMDEFMGSKRILPIVARLIAGDRSLGPAVYQMFAGPGGDRDVDTMTIKALLRARDSEFLPALYSRIGLGVMSFEQVGAAVDVAKLFTPDLALPILRRILCSPDQGLRQQAEAVMAAIPELGKWQDDVVAAERLALKAKHLFNGQAQVVRQCLKLLSQAMGDIAHLSMLDYGFALDMSLVVNSWGKREDLLPLVQPSLMQSKVNSGSSWEIVERLLVIARTHGRPSRGSVELLAGQQPRAGESGRIPLLVRVTVEKNSGALVGGFALETEFLGAILQDESEKTVGIPQGLILPTTGVLPGESLILAVPLLLPTSMGRHFRIGIRLGRGDQNIFAISYTEVAR